MLEKQGKTTAQVGGLDAPDRDCLRESEDLEFQAEALFVTKEG